MTSTSPTRPLSRVRFAVLALLIFVLAAAADAACAAAASPTASPTPVDKPPFINWQSLGIYLGGVVILLALMLLFIRVFGSRQHRGQGGRG